jgi:2,4-dienoyl-CoA reductase (NADPH2)
MKKMRDKRLDILFEPLEMTNLTLKNRFFMAPIGTTFDMSQLRDLWVARAKGEVGLITTGLVSVHPGGHAIASSELSLETDDDILVFSPVVKAVQNAGAKIVPQLSHAGRYTSGKQTGEQSVAPSPIASRYTGETPRELSEFDWSPHISE